MRGPENCRGLRSTPADLRPWSGSSGVFAFLAQFARAPGRGARDGVLFFAIAWLAAFASGRRVAPVRTRRG
eukprot:14010552-Alexandrium_andersonii.AAC.1